MDQPSSVYETKNIVHRINRHPRKPSAIITWSQCTCCTCTQEVMQLLVVLTQSYSLNATDHATRSTAASTSCVHCDAYEAAIEESPPELVSHTDKAGEICKGIALKQLVLDGVIGHVTQHPAQHALDHTMRMHTPSKLRLACSLFKRLSSCYRVYSESILSSQGQAMSGHRTTAGNLVFHGIVFHKQIFHIASAFCRPINTVPGRRVLYLLVVGSLH